MINLKIFKQLVWEADRLKLDELVFRLEHYKDKRWELGDECFVFYKVKELVDQYAQFFSLRGHVGSDRVMELGIWDGGSVAFWFEILQPSKHVALDVTARSNTAYFERYLDSRNARQRISTFWRTDQADAGALRRIVRSEFKDAPLDLVIDDASHLYEPTKASFEALFPILRPGGLYIIEDWAWMHWPEFLSENRGWVNRIPLTQLVFELVEAAGSSKDGMVGNVTVFEGFVAIERGVRVLDGDEFRLGNHISRPQLTPMEHLAHLRGRVKSAGRTLLHALARRRA